MLYLAVTTNLGPAWKRQAFSGVLRETVSTALCVEPSIGALLKWNGSTTINNFHLLYFQTCDAAERQTS